MTSTSATRRSWRPFVLLLVLAVLLPAAAFGQFTDTSGQTASGAHYKLRVPTGWTPANGLVIWNHGYSFGPTGPVDELGPLAALQLSEGYAIAASSYRQSQWAVFGTVEDVEQMVEAFEDLYAPPAFVLVYGASLGGLVTAQLVEVADIGNVVGAMPICGALAGSRAWDGAIDARLLYDAICGEVPGAAIPGGGTGLPFPPDPNFTPVTLDLALTACFGSFANPGTRTLDQQARLDRYLDLTGLPENFVQTVMTFSTFGLADLIYNPLKLNGATHAVDNSHVDYGDAIINANIERVTGDPAQRALLAANYTPSGNIGDTRIVSLHTNKDGLVILEHESDYAAKVPGNRFSLGIVNENVATHCGFTAAELVAGWESLRSWLGTGVQPTATTMQGLCQVIEGSGAAAGPCRIDPAQVLPPVDGRLRLRDTCTGDDDTLCLGDNDRFKVEVTWEDFQGQTGVGHAVTQTDNTGAFYYFDATNLEMMIKVLDGRHINGHFWVFYGSLSNVEFTATVTDTVTGAIKTYHNASGTFASAGDTSAF